MTYMQEESIRHEFLWVGRICGSFFKSFSCSLVRRTIASEWNISMDGRFSTSSSNKAIYCYISEKQLTRKLMASTQIIKLKGLTCTLPYIWYIHMNYTLFFPKFQIKKTHPPDQICFIFLYTMLLNSRINAWNSTLLQFATYKSPEHKVSI